MSKFLFVVFFAIPAALCLAGSVAFKSFHLFVGGAIMALASAIFFVAAKAGEKKQRGQEKTLSNESH